jgi:hypothetical protein
MFTYIFRQAYIYPLTPRKEPNVIYRIKRGGNKTVRDIKKLEQSLNKARGFPMTYCLLLSAKCVDLIIAYCFFYKLA